MHAAWSSKLHAMAPCQELVERGPAQPHHAGRQPRSDSMRTYRPACHLEVWAAHDVQIAAQYLHCNPAANAAVNQYLIIATLSSFHLQRGHSKMGLTVSAGNWTSFRQGSSSLRVCTKCLAWKSAAGCEQQ